MSKERKRKIDTIADYCLGDTMVAEEVDKNIRSRYGFGFDFKMNPHKYISEFADEDLDYLLAKVKKEKIQRIRNAYTASNRSCS